MIHPIAHPARRVHHELVDQVKLMHLSYDLVGGEIIYNVISAMVWADDPSNNQSI